MRPAQLVPNDPFLTAVFTNRSKKPQAMKEARDAQASFRLARRQSKAGSASRMGARTALRNVYAVQQAVVKITRQGRTKGGNALRNQLQYVSRAGSEDLQGQGGEIFEPGADGRYPDLVEEWQADIDGMDQRATFGTYHLVVSYPQGTDPIAAKLAATEFAQELTSGSYGDHWKYALAHHRDTQYPHSHVILNRVGANGRTLQLNRDSISIQDLRELHVETAGHQGILLNASSRFSRNVEERPLSSGRLHAERAGRQLKASAEQEPGKSQFPLYGASKRTELTIGDLQEARADLAKQYRAVAAQFTEFAPKFGAVPNDDLIRRLERAAELVRADQALTEESLAMADTTATAPDKQKSVASGAAAEAELKKMQKDVAEIYEKSRTNIEKIDDEAKKTEAEKALAKIMREFDDFLDPKDRERFGKGVEREEIKKVELSDNDPARQRLAASREAEEGKQPATTDERTRKARERLEKADKDARTLFQNRGMNADIAVQRIRDTPDVDRETREKWMDRDIQSLARTANVSEKDARETTTKAYRDAARIYAKARDDIRDIKIDPAQTREKSAAKPAIDRAKQTRGRDRGGLDR